MSDGRPAAEGAPGPPATPAPRRRMRNYLIDTKLQLRFASYLIAMAAAISLGLGWLLWDAYRESSRLVAIGDPRLDDALAAVLAREDRARIFWLALVLVAVVGCLLVFAVVVTHRVAGPAVFLARTCRGVGEGRLQRPRSLRRRDLLVDLADEVGLMIEALREREGEERAALAGAAERLRRPGASPAESAVAETLERIAAEKARRLGP